MHGDTNDLPKLRDYTIVEQLYSGFRTQVYRAIHPQFQQPVILKLLASKTPSFSDLLQFRNQYTITQHFCLPGIARPLDLIPWQKGYVLVMEDFGGISLAQYTQRHYAQGKSLNWQDIWAIALQLSDILHTLCQHRIVHKDIKPSHILIHPESKAIQLIDFSIASLLPRETQEIQAPNVLEGTLPYLAPEQTGRMNRGVDYRADFYGLGVTLYELLTGELPFQADDPLELVHCHLVKLPIPPHQLNPAIPPMVSAIVLKLMAKNAEDRYQSAFGLKHDLTQCLHQWRTTGTVETFALAQQDVSDRFLIPEKLYGREADVHTLLASFERVAQGTSELMLVAGFSGIGKTAVVNEVHKPITQRHGYFIKGKFDQFNRNIPFSAFVQAFRSLMGQILGESEAALETWKYKILTAVGNMGQVMVDVIPELETIIGAQPPIPELSGTAAQNRFNLVFSQFIRVFTTVEHPLVIFLDDLQWADAASLSLLQQLMDDYETGYLLVIGAYRDNEVFPAHPLMLTLKVIQQAGVPVCTLTLPPLDSDHITRLVADTLQCPPEIATPLAHLVYQKTQGNPFFTTQFLQGLHEDGWITFERDAGHWQCDLSRVKHLALTDDVVAFMASRLRKLSLATQSVLKRAACIGNRFDLLTLAMVCHLSPEAIATALWQGLQEGFVVPENETYKFFQGHTEETDGLEPLTVYYRFLHDRVQQAAYELIPSGERASTHLEIGQSLLAALSREEQEEAVFAITNQFNLGRSSLTDAAQRHTLAALNLKAGRRAKLSAAYEAARQYYDSGRELVSDEVWETDYPLMYALHREGSEMDYLCGQFEAAETLYAIALRYAKTPLDQAVIYRVQMTQYQLQGRNADAIALVKPSLQRLGLSLPLESAAARPALDAEVASVNDFLQDQSISSILDLPRTEEDEIVEALRILQILFYAAWLDGQTTLGFLALVKMTTLSLHHGNSEMSPFGYVGYGLVANAFLHNAAQACEFGKMAVHLAEQFDNADVRGMTNFIFAADVQSWSRPLRAAEPYYMAAYQSAMEAGNWLTASFMMIQSGSDRLTYGKNLEELLAIAQDHADFLHRIKSLENLDVLTAGVLQPIRQLQGHTKTLTSFDDEHFSEAAYLKHYAQNPFSLAWLYSVKIRNAVLLGQTATYADLIPKLDIVETAVPSHGKVPSTVFYTALMHIALSRTADPDTQQTHRVACAQLEAKLTRWAHDCPENIHHKCLLLQAERASIDGNKAEAIEKYDQAIATAQQQEFTYEVAIANELAAEFYLAWQKEAIATTYLQEAHYRYAQWGATAKVAQLEARYPQLLPVLQPASLAESLVADPPPIACSASMLKDATQRWGQASLWLDFPAVLKAAQAISQEMELPNLLATLMRMMITTAGAQRGCLVLREGDRWNVVAQANAAHSTPDIQCRALDEVPEIPVGILYSVARTQRTSVFEDLSADPQWMGDSDVMARHPRSVLCIPIQRPEKLVGLLYLENNEVIGAFTHDRVEVLHLLASQAAISLENARLYQQVEAYSHNLEMEVDHKTQELRQKAQDLEQALDTLKQAQAHLVQSEKMSSLGQLVAGIAHEINNPVNFIYGNLDYITQYSDVLLEILDRFAQEYPQLSPTLQARMVEADLAFIREDFPKTLASMKVGTDRIRQLVLSLRNFSRLDEAAMKSVDLHEGIESTLMILQYRLKSTSNLPCIQVEKQYGKLPMVECYASQINQVFMNLLSNAIDALEDGITDTNGTEKTADHSPQITIRTFLSSANAASTPTAVVQISDNGPGIPASLQPKLFDPFFTTKPIGKGTGLGLSISYQIIVERHQGTLQCASQPGRGTTFWIEIPVKRLCLSS